MANVVTFLPVPAFSEEDVADSAIAQQLDGLPNDRAGASLCAVGGNLVAFWHSRREQLAFANVVGAGFLDVHVFTSVECEESDGRVPVIGCGDRYGVDGPIVENAAEVGDAVGPASCAECFGQTIAIDI